MTTRRDFLKACAGVAAAASLPAAANPIAVKITTKLAPRLDLETMSVQVFRPATGTWVEVCSYHSWLEVATAKEPDFLPCGGSPRYWLPGEVA